MANTPRLGLRRPAGADAFNIAGDFQQIVDILDNSAIWQSGTFAARPAANTVKAGTIYRSADTADVSVSDGTTWFTMTPTSRSLACATGGGGSATTAAGNTKVTGFTETVDLGGDFASNRFVAPVKGAYEFDVTGYGSDFATGESCVVKFRVNNGTFYEVGGVDEGTRPATNFSRFSGTLVLQLNPGDYVEVWFYNNVSASRSISSVILTCKLLAQLP